MKYISLCILFLAMTCNSPKKESSKETKEVLTEENIKTNITPVKEKENQLVVVLNNPKEIEDAKALVTNSGLEWSDLNWDVAGVQSAIITVPLDKKDFWMQRLQESNVFEYVKNGNLETIDNLKSELNNRLISIKKTACFGDCPVYSFSITKDGKPIFNGKQFVVEEGKHEFELSEKELQTLIDKIQNSDFSKLAESYDDPRIQDLPTTFIFCNGKQIKVRLWQNIPEDLVNIHEYVTEFLYDKKFLE